MHEFGFPFIANDDTTYDLVITLQTAAGLPLSQNTIIFPRSGDLSGSIGTFEYTIIASEAGASLVEHASGSY
jgi:hypothetical protein